MPGLLKLLLVGAALAAVPTLESNASSPEGEVVTAVIAGAADAGSPQDPNATGVRAAGGAVEKSWNFAVLAYVTAQGERIELAARNLTRVHVLHGADGRTCLEIVHANNDYSFVVVTAFDLIRTSGSFSSVDVPIMRTTLDGMAFPAFD